MFSSKDLFFTVSSGPRVPNSLRFRSSASAYLSRTFGTPTSTTIWTWSAWIKRGGLTGTYRLFGASTTTYLTFNSSDQINLTINNVSAATSTAVFRDPSAWYHVVYQQNGSAQTIWVNNQSVATGTTAASVFNTAIAHQIGAANTTNYFDGYLTQINFIDGQALTPSSFGAYDTNGIWQPTGYGGSSYGNNGFYLPFTDNSALTTSSNAGIGKDFSGNSNYWITNNISITSGTTYDSMIDSPTNYADGGNGRGNYAVLSPIIPNAGITLSQGNLQTTQTTANANSPTFSTIAMPAGSGKWYWEITFGTVTSASDFNFGIAIASKVAAAWTTANYLIYNPSNSSFLQYGSSGGTITGFSPVANDVVGIAVDMTAGTMAVYLNNTLKGTSSAVNTAVNHVAIVGSYAINETMFLNFGQRPFIYTPPSGFSALNTQNLDTPTITNGAQYMAAVTYTGTGSSQTITTSSTNSGNNPNGTTFQPDLVWVKGRSGATDHAWYDAVRGVQLQLESNTTTAETTETTGLTAFTSSGFTTGALAQMNTNTATYVAWEWNAGGSTVTNTTGSISAQVRANTSAGFSVATFTVPNSASPQTFGHGLGVTPGMVIIKYRSTTSSWFVYHTSLPSTYVLLLNSTAAQNTAGTYITAVSSSTVSLGSSLVPDATTPTAVAYCFAPVAGYSAFGSYTGNGLADGPFVYCGFRPRWVLIKRTDAAENWVVWDTSRNLNNVTNALLKPNQADAEGTALGSIDILSNGFKLRTDNTLNGNASGGTYIYAAFAENPFKISRAR